MGIVEKLENSQRKKPITHPGRIADMRKCGSNVARCAAFPREGPNLEFLCELPQFFKSWQLIQFLKYCIGQTKLLFGLDSTMAHQFAISK